MGIVMREDPEELLPGDPHQRRPATGSADRPRCQGHLGVGRIIERVPNGLLCTKVDLPPTGRQALLR